MSCLDSWEKSFKIRFTTETEHLFVVVLGPLKTWKLSHVVSFLKLPNLYMNGPLSWLNPSIHLSISSCWSKVCMRRRVIIIQGAPGGVHHTFLGIMGYTSKSNKMLLNLCVPFVVAVCVLYFQQIFFIKNYLMHRTQTLLMHLWSSSLIQY